MNFHNRQANHRPLPPGKPGQMRKWATHPDGHGDYVAVGLIAKDGHVRNRGQIIDLIKEDLRGYGTRFSGNWIEVEAMDRKGAAAAARRKQEASGEIQRTAANSEGRTLSASEEANRRRAYEASLQLTARSDLPALGLDQIEIVTEVAADLGSQPLSDAEAELVRTALDVPQELEENSAPLSPELEEVEMAREATPAFLQEMSGTVSGTFVAAFEVWTAQAQLVCVPIEPASVESSEKAVAPPAEQESSVEEERLRLIVREEIGRAIAEMSVSAQNPDAFKDAIREVIAELRQVAAASDSATPDKKPAAGWSAGVKESLMAHVNASQDEDEELFVVVPCPEDHERRFITASAISSAGDLISPDTLSRIMSRKWNRQEIIGKEPHYPDVWKFVMATSFRDAEGLVEDGLYIGAPHKQAETPPTVRLSAASLANDEAKFAEADKLWAVVPGTTEKRCYHTRHAERRDGGLYSRGVLIQSFATEWEKTEGDAPAPQFEKIWKFVRAESPGEAANQASKGNFVVPPRALEPDEDVDDSGLHGILSRPTGRKVLVGEEWDIHRVKIKGLNNV